MNVPPIGIIHIRLNKWDTFTQCTVSSMGRPGWWGDTQESSSFRRWFFMKNIDYFCVKMFLSNRQTFGDTSPELQLSCLDSGYCRWWVLNITQTSHGKNVMHNGIDKVCVKCTAQWDCLRGAGVTFFWIGWEHDLSLPSLYIKCRQTNTDHCQCVDDKLTLWREKVCPITSASVCALTEFSSHVGIQVNPNKCFASHLFKLPKALQSVKILVCSNFKVKMAGNSYFNIKYQSKACIFLCTQLWHHELISKILSVIITRNRMQ